MVNGFVVEEERMEERRLKVEPARLRMMYGYVSRYRARWSMVMTMWKVGSFTIQLSTLQRGLVNGHVRSQSNIDILN